jgi:signal transduction histidine kinase
MMTRAVTLLRAGLIVSVAGLCIAFVDSYRHATDAARAAAYGRDVRQLKSLDARLNQEILRSRSGLLTHYDTVARNVRELRSLLLSLMDAPHFLGKPAVQDLRTRLEAIGQLIEQKSELTESFKSHNAVLRNSQRFLPVAARALGDRVPATAAIHPKLHRLLTALMHLGVSRDRDGVPVLTAATDELEVLATQEGGYGEEVVILVRHARAIGEREPIVDALVARILLVPLAGSAAELDEAFFAHYRTALRGEGARLWAVFGFATAVVALGLIDVIVRLRQGRAALERATDELRAANLALAKEREKERELGEMKTRFVSMASHEFRGPLSAILSSSELLDRYGERWDRPRRLDHYEAIRASVRSMSQLLDEILLIGRAQAGVLAPYPAPVNLDELSKEVVQAISRASNDTHNIRRSLVGEENVVLDERLVRHLLSNLLDNAIKYSAAGSEVELHVDAQGAEIRFTVRDHGMGIPEEDLPHLFTTFCRGANVGQIEGSGLGLAVVKHVVDAQHGNIGVKSKVGLGTEFVVVLPKYVESGALSARDVS